MIQENEQDVLVLADIALCPVPLRAPAAVIDGDDPYVVILEDAVHHLILKDAQVVVPLVVVQVLDAIVCKGGGGVLIFRDFVPWIEVGKEREVGDETVDLPQQVGQDDEEGDQPCRGLYHPLEIEDGKGQECQVDEYDNDHSHIEGTDV